MKIIDTSFSGEQLAILIPSIILILASIFCYTINKTRAAVFLLLLGALGLRIFMIILDPFLNEWDERYHALVAKNMMSRPLVPRLWPEAVLPYNYKEWCCNYIWLHKQPMFLWQMALSMKIFGVNEIAVRIPSLLLNTLQVWLTYRIGVLVHNKKLGYIAALMSALSYFALEQVSGSMGREHNDVAFFFYLTASFWSLGAYLNKPRTIFLILIGLFAGFAVLNKWLVGLMVFPGWFAGAAMHKKGFWLNLKRILLAFLMVIMVFMPWQLYIMSKFPAESAYEYEFNRRHIFEPIEGHAGDWLYYFKNNYILYGNWNWVLMILGVIAFAFIVRKSILKSAILTSVFIIYLFFTIAQSKFVSYVFVSSFIFLFMASGILFLEEKLFDLKIPLSAKRLLIGVILVLTGFFTFRHWKIESYHARNKPNYFGYGPQRIDRIKDAKILRDFKSKIPPGYLIFNTTQPIEVMFYTDNIAYFWIDEKDYIRLKNAHYPMAAIKSDQHPIPFYLERDSNMLILDPGLKN